MRGPAQIRGAHRLRLVAARPSRRLTARTRDADLSSLSLQLAELQQQFGAQIRTLEHGLQQQRQELIDSRTRLSRWKQHIDRLTAASATPLS